MCQIYLEVPVQSVSKLTFSFVLVLASLSAFANEVWYCGENVGTTAAGLESACFVDGIGSERALVLEYPGHATVRYPILSESPSEYAKVTTITVQDTKQRTSGITVYRHYI